MKLNLKQAKLKKYERLITQLSPEQSVESIHYQQRQNRDMIRSSMYHKSKDSFKINTQYKNVLSVGKSL